jgi:hypothetical protein
VDPVQRSTNGTGLLSITDVIFRAQRNSSKLVTISRTVEFDRDADVDLAKPIYGLDPSHAMRRSFEDGQKHAEAF